MACLIDSTWPASISAAPDAARLRNDDDSPDKFTFASPAEPPALCAGAFEALAAAAVALSPCCVRCAPSCNDDTLELLVESIFTIGFPNDLSVITAHPNQTLAQSSAPPFFHSAGNPAIRPR